MHFVKMHGLGNDYIYINAFETVVVDPVQLAQRMSAYHVGVGSDGLILIEPSPIADISMRMFNRDGSHGLMCGNGARCVARYAFDRGLVTSDTFTLASSGVVYPVQILADAVTIDMGCPVWNGNAEGHTLVTVGNPHAVRVVDFDPFQWEGFERDGSSLCKKLDINVEYVQPLPDGSMRMRVWERGSNETWACGSGACAAAAVAIAQGLCSNRVTVHLKGGDMVIHQTAEGHLLMTGPTTTVFEGDWPD